MRKTYWAALHHHQVEGADIEIFWVLLHIYLRNFAIFRYYTVQYKGVTGELSDEENILGSPTSSSGVWWGNKKYSGFYCIFI